LEEQLVPAKKHKSPFCLRVAIFGAAGTLGAEIARNLIKRSESEAGVFIMPKTRELLDVSDLQYLYSWLWYARPSIIVWAAVADPKRASDSWRVNVEAVDVLTKFCAVNGSFLVYISCHSVFSGYRTCPISGIHEAMPIKPACRLGHEIAAAENCILRAGQILESRRHGFSYVILRVGPLFGGAHERPSSLAASVLASCRAGRTAFHVSPTIVSPAYVPHVANLVIDFIDNSKKVCPGIYHVANQGRCSEREFCYELAASQGYTIGIMESFDSAMLDSSGFGCRDDEKHLHEQVVPLNCSRLAMLNKSLPPWRDAVREYLRSQENAFSVP
jgi:dTDP-4-dehydrorhamnose reductase